MPAVVFARVNNYRITVRKLPFGWVDTYAVPFKRAVQFIVLLQRRPRQEGKRDVLALIRNCHRERCYGLFYAFTGLVQGPRLRFNAILHFNWDAVQRFRPYFYGVRKVYVYQWRVDAEAIGAYNASGERVQIQRRTASNMV